MDWSGDIILLEKSLYCKSKRVFDIMVGWIFHILSLSLLGIIALFIKLASKCPVFYNQVRLGKNGKPYSVTAKIDVVYPYPETSSWTSLSKIQIHFYWPESILKTSFLADDIYEKSSW